MSKTRKPKSITLEQICHITIIQPFWSSMFSSFHVLEIICTTLINPLTMQPFVFHQHPHIHLKVYHDIHQILLLIPLHHHRHRHQRYDHKITRP